MVMLVIKSAENRETIEQANLDRLQALAQVELYERPRWKPIRRALGFYAQGPAT